MYATTRKIFLLILMLSNESHDVEQTTNSSRRQRASERQSIKIRALVSLVPAKSASFLQIQMVANLPKLIHHTKPLCSLYSRGYNQPISLLHFMVVIYFLGPKVPPSSQRRSSCRCASGEIWFPAGSFMVPGYCVFLHHHH